MVVASGWSWKLITRERDGVNYGMEWSCNGGKDGGWEILKDKKVKKKARKGVQRRGRAREEIFWFCWMCSSERSEQIMVENHRCVEKEGDLFYRIFVGCWNFSLRQWLSEVVVRVSLKALFKWAVDGKRSADLSGMRISPLGSNSESWNHVASCWKSPNLCAYESLRVVGDQQMQSTVRLCYCNL
jgi:hypothetical protein